MGILKLFPGISREFVKGILNVPGLKAIVMETFGSGNAASAEWFISELDQCIKSGMIVVNVSQCITGTVEQGKYETSLELKNIGVISGLDITTESALSKLMYLLGRYGDQPMVTGLMQKSIRGEISE